MSGLEEVIFEIAFLLKQGIIHVLQMTKADCVSSVIHLFTIARRFSQLTRYWGR